MALVPEDVNTLCRQGFEVAVARGAGRGSFIGDGAYRKAGAAVVGAAEAMACAAVLSVGGPETLIAAAPGLGEAAGSRSGEKLFIGAFDPLWRPGRAQRMADAGLSGFSLDLIPRITRAQSMDVLSSMGVIAGYEAVLLAASRLPQMFPLMMTAAGTLTPARVLVLGAGVAGLQAIATARRLGAVVEGYDVRAAALEQIRSMGARALEIDDSADAGSDGAEGSDGYARAQSERTALRQRELLESHVAAADVVVCTAAIPGRASPLLVTEEMVESMKPGSVVIDLAVERGGNCALTQADADTVHSGVTVLGPTDLVSRSARHASEMFSRNLTALLGHLAPGGELALDADDEITAAILVTRGGAIVHPAVADAADARTADSSAPATG